MYYLKNISYFIKWFYCLLLDLFVVINFSLKLFSFKRVITLIGYKVVFEDKA